MSVPDIPLTFLFFVVSDTFVDVAFVNPPVVRSRDACLCKYIHLLSFVDGFLDALPPACRPSQSIILYKHG